jgi:hypothetical protein
MEIASPKADSMRLEVGRSSFMEAVMETEFHWTAFDPENRRYRSPEDVRLHVTAARGALLYGHGEVLAPRWSRDQAAVIGAVLDKMARAGMSEVGMGGADARVLGFSRSQHLHNVLRIIVKRQAWIVRSQDPVMRVNIAYAAKNGRRFWYRLAG